MFTNQEQHQMRLEKVHDSDAEEWVCESCSRRMLIQWTPKFKRIILDRGEENAVHSGSKGGLVMNSSTLTISPPTADDQSPLPNEPLESPAGSEQIISDDLLAEIDKFFADLDDSSE